MFSTHDCLEYLETAHIEKEMFTAEHSSEHNEKKKAKILKIIQRWSLSWHQNFKILIIFFLLSEFKRQREQGEILS